MAERGIIQRSTMESIAEQTRRLSGTTEKISPKKAVEILEGITPAGEETAYILVDDSGTEIQAVLVDEDVELTATAKSDIRLGTTAITNEGIVEGEKEIPSYHTTEGFKLVPSGSKFVVYLSNGKHEYTKMQAIFCPFNTTFDDSVAAEKVAISNNVYAAKSTVSEAPIMIINDPNGVDFGITNSSNISWLIRYFTYKEVY